MNRSSGIVRKTLQDMAAAAHNLTIHAEFKLLVESIVEAVILAVCLFSGPLLAKIIVTTVVPDTIFYQVVFIFFGSVFSLFAFVFALFFLSNLEERRRSKAKT